MAKEYGNTKKIGVWTKVMAKVWPNYGWPGQDGFF